MSDTSKPKILGQDASLPQTPRLGSTDADDNTTPDPTLVSLPSNPSGEPQKLEIQIQNHQLPSSDKLEAKIVIPWIIAVLGWGVAFFFYILNRNNKITDDFHDMVVGDVKDFLGKMEEICTAVASHQGACPCRGNSLKESRQHLTTLRRAAVAVSGRIENAFVNGLDRDQWKKLFRQWKIDTEGETGWITNKNKKWSISQMERLEDGNEKFIREITAFRNKIATRKIKIQA